MTHCKHFGFEHYPNGARAAKPLSVYAKLSSSLLKTYRINYIINHLPLITASNVQEIL